MLQQGLAVRQLTHGRRHGCCPRPVPGVFLARAGQDPGQPQMEDPPCDQQPADGQRRQIGDVHRGQPGGGGLPKGPDPGQVHPVPQRRYPADGVQPPGQHVEGEIGAGEQRQRQRHQAGEDRKLATVPVQAGRPRHHRIAERPCRQYRHRQQDQRAGGRDGAEEQQHRQHSGAFDHVACRRSQPVPLRELRRCGRGGGRRLVQLVPFEIRVHPDGVLHLRGMHRGRQQ